MNAWKYAGISRGGLIVVLAGYVAFAAGPAPAPAACVSDADGDGVCDNLDLCPGTIAGAEVDGSGCPLFIPGDSDRDGDVDGDDFALLAFCASGPAQSASLVCQTFDFDYDLDSDIDLADAAAFELCFSGRGVPGDPQCASGTARIDGDCLHVVGTAADTPVSLRLRAGDSTVLEVDLGNDGPADFAFLRADFTCIVVDARDGDDVVVIDETNGVFTTDHPTTIYGGAGADTLFGGSGGEVFVGGPGDDAAFLGAGGDRFIWNAGDGADLIEGDAGVDVIEVNGANAAESFTVTANGTRVRFDVLSPVASSLDLGGGEQLTLNAGGGDDQLACTGNLAALITITADGGPGADTLLGCNGADVLIGGDDADVIDGQQGNDLILLGAGDDVVQWDPGDGSDTVEGQDGVDRFELHGSNANENYTFSANGDRLRFTRDLGNIVHDIAGLEVFALHALGGADTAVVNDLTGTDLAELDVRLATPLGGVGADAQIDTVIVSGTNGADNIVVTGSAAGVSVLGTVVELNIRNAEPTNDRLTINGLGGADVVDASDLPGGLIFLTLDGGPGDDALIGSGGGDVLIGGDNHDVIEGGDGDDIAALGSGNDRFVWNVGDDTDSIEGGDGSDTVEVNGADGDEQFVVTANGTRVRFDRVNPAPFFLDIGTCENLQLFANGGSDTLNCTGNLAALIAITADGGPGADTLNGSNGADVLIGGDGNDVIDGNQGNDLALLGAGFDTFRWDPGDGSDTVEGQDDYDVIQFNGSNAAEIYDLSANGGRVRLTRNLGNIVMDLAGVERFDLQCLGGADVATVNNLAGTDADRVNLDLAPTFGGTIGDSQVDMITVQGTPSADTLNVVSSVGGVEVWGLPVLTRITHSEAVNDRLTVNGLGGVDTLTTGPGVSSLIAVTFNP